MTRQDIKAGPLTSPQNPELRIVPGIVIAPDFEIVKGVPIDMTA